MTTAYTPILKLALPVTGELSGTWGNVVNDNITSMVEQAVAGLATINTWTSNVHTLTTADGTTSESRCAMLVAATGAGGTALSAAGQIVCPAASKLYVLQNGSAYAVTLKTASGTGVAVPAGQAAFLFCDGTNVNACVTTIVDASVSGNLTVDGNTTLGNATTDTITATGQFNTDLLPSTDNARDLGSTAKSWRTLYCETSVLTALVTTTNLQVTNIKANDSTPAITIADSTGAVTVSTLLNVDNLRLETNTLSSTDTNGNITLAPNGTGDVQLDADTIRVGDSGANVTITSNGAGDLILNTNSGTNSGSITIEDGANGAINLTPNGTGAVILPLLRLSGSTSGYVGLKGAATAGSTTYTLPAADGTSGQVLSTNGTGTLSWVAAAASGVTTFSAGTTGFTPSTATSGAVTLAGTLAIANGGTGQTTATAAFNALAPSQTSNSGKYLTTDGTNTSWGTVSASPGGSTTQIQYNNAGAFGGSANFTWNNTTSTLTVNSINIGRGGNNIATNMFIGTAATGATVNSFKNVAVGVAALNGVTNGQLNVAVGWNALNGINTGTSNVAIGNNAGALLTSASFNTAVGAFALDNATGGSSNVALGYSALTADVTGSNNTSVGTSSGQALTSGYNNVFVGYLAGSAIDVGFSTVAVGSNALRSVVSSGYNVGVGEYAGRDTTGQQNTLIGYQAGYTLAAGDNNTIIGYNAVPSSTTASNEITLGNSSIATLRCQVTTITALSDARDKKDVQDIPLGVSFVQRLRPVSFVWNTRDGGKVDVPEFGFIAQELQQAQAAHGVTLPGLVHDINPDRLEAAPGTLIPVLVKAVQELQAQIDALKQQLAARG
jgi:trimeric autotransporter adhesin